MRDRFEELETTCESVLQAPFRPWREVRECRLEVFVVNVSCQVFRSVELVLDERAIDDLFRLGRETIRILLQSHELKPWREKKLVYRGTQ